MVFLLLSLSILLYIIFNFCLFKFKTEDTVDLSLSYYAKSFSSLFVSVFASALSFGLTLKTTCLIITVIWGAYLLFFYPIGFLISGPAETSCRRTCGNIAFLSLLIVLCVVL